MKTYQYKTNINCQHCVATVKPELDKLEGVSEWQVETGDKDKILVVKGEGLESQKIEEAVKKAGFTAIPKKESLLNSLFKKK